MWQVIGASVRGSSHVRNGTPCQDSFQFRIITDEFLVVALADGLGSAARSEVGSSLAVNAAIDVIETRLHNHHPQSEESWVLLLQDAFGTARMTLEMHAEEDEISLRELGTTLLIAVYDPGTLAIGHLGDGAIVGMWDNGDLATVSAPERGEYANTVIPLTWPTALDRVRYDIIRTSPMSAIMMSDGVQHLALDAKDGQPYPAFFLPLFRAVREMTDPGATARDLEAFLASERMDARTDDDRTLVIINRAVSEKPPIMRRRRKLRQSK